MSDFYWSLTLADGTVVNGPIQGSGGTIPGWVEFLQTQIDLATEGEPLGIYEPRTGHAKMRWYRGDVPGPEEPHQFIDLRGARINPRRVTCCCCGESFETSKSHDPDRDFGFGTCIGCQPRIARDWVKHGYNGRPMTLAEARARQARFA